MKKSIGEKRRPDRQQSCTRISIPASEQSAIPPFGAARHIAFKLPGFRKCDDCRYSEPLSILSSSWDEVAGLWRRPMPLDPPIRTINGKGSDLYLIPA